MGRFLTDVAHYAHCVPVAGSVEFHAKDGAVWVLALLQAQVTNQGDAWHFMVDQLARLLESMRNIETDPQAGMDAMAARLQVLARRVAELHVALAQPHGLAAFDPEPIRAADLERWCCRRAPGVRSNAGAARAAPCLAERISCSSGDADRGGRASPECAHCAGGHGAAAGLKTRLHGDLHLQQVLIARDDFLIIDFEGEPQRPLEERRAKHCALRDVAGMLRSLDYARHTALHQTAQGAAELERLAPVARRWERFVRQAFVQAYREVVVASGLYANEAAFERSAALLDLFELEKALYELRYELDNRPDWVGVPLAGIAALAGCCVNPPGPDDQPL
jgi:maltose alpha-D-glucosyltransferase/alpha-amylase